MKTLGLVGPGVFEKPEGPEKLEKPSKTTSMHVYESDLKLARSISSGSTQEVFRDILQRLRNKKDGSMITRHLELLDKFPCGTRYEDLGVFHCKETSHPHKIDTIRECGACPKRRLKATVEKNIAIHGQKADVFHTELKVREHEANVAFQTITIGGRKVILTCNPEKSHNKDGLLEVCSKLCPKCAERPHPYEICLELLCPHIQWAPEVLEAEAVKKVLAVHTQKRKQGKKKPGVQELDRV